MIIQLAREPTHAKRKCKENVAHRRSRFNEAPAQLECTSEHNLLEAVVACVYKKYTTIVNCRVQFNLNTDIVRIS